MYLTVHTAVGAAISTQTDNPLVAFAEGFASHFILDFIPHGDERVGEWLVSTRIKFMIVSIVDLSLALCLSVFILANSIFSGGNFIVTFAGIAGAVLPDFLSMGFPEFYVLTKSLALVRSAYRALQVAHVPPVVAEINAIHHDFHQFISKRFNFRFNLLTGSTLQAIFLFFLLEWLLGQ